MAITIITTTPVVHDLQNVERGLDFILSHFEDIQPLWPRKISTLATEGGQVAVNNREQALSYLETADLIDCRINAYPQYREGVLYEPNHLFIDLDCCTFPTDQDCTEALKTTLQNIKTQLGSSSPTVIWSGNGYHMHQPLDMPLPLERVTEFACFREPSKQFLRYAERILSNSKADPNHNPSFKSCLFRVPGTYNLKCIYSGKHKDSEVRVIQRWDGVRVRPSKEFMLGFTPI
jgi:hypothetical protein